mgnify:CR=1 FL=1
MKIYVCSPYRGDVGRNVENAIKCCKFVINQGHNPIAPHLYYTQFLNDNIPSERVTGMRLGAQVLVECDEVWVFGDKITVGMEDEIELAKRYGKRVIYLGGGKNL